jgi:transposase InsO family protein
MDSKSSTDAALCAWCGRTIHCTAGRFCSPSSGRIAVTEATLSSCPSGSTTRIPAAWTDDGAGPIADLTPGSNRLSVAVARELVTLERPAVSTVSAIFAKYGLSRTRQARRRTPPYTDPFSDALSPNELWCTDFKGDFRTGDGRRCYPLTLTDACSRMLLRCTALPSTKVGGVRLPRRIRCAQGRSYRPHSLERRDGHDQSRA